MLTPSPKSIRPSSTRRPIHLWSFLLGTLALPLHGDDTAQEYVFTTLAGGFAKQGSTDGDGATATFNHPIHLCRDVEGNIYVTDWLTSPPSGTSVRRVTPGGRVTTIARFPLMHFGGLAADRSGSIYVSLRHAIGRIDPTGTLAIIAGERGNPGNADGIGSEARFWEPSGLTIDDSGNLVIADTGNSLIRRLSPAGEVTTLADLSKLPRPPAEIQQPAIAQPIHGPTSVAMDSSGNLYFADVHAEHPYWGYYYCAVWKLPRVASTGRWAEPVLLLPYEEDDRQIAVEPSGNVYASGLWSASIDKITAAGTRLRIAGRNNLQLAEWRNSRDGPASEARFLRPFGIAVDSTGHFTFAEIDGPAIRTAFALSGREPDARISNVSVRASIGPEQSVDLRIDQRNESQPALLRGVGPGLASLMPEIVPARDLWLEAPKSVFVAPFDANTGNAAEIRAAHERTGAFPLSSGDVVAVRSMESSTEVRFGSTTTIGVAMFEWFDLGDRASRGLRSLFLRRLDQPRDLVVGFVISGSEQKLVALRANTESETSPGRTAGVPNAVRLAVFDRLGRLIAETSASPTSIAPVLQHSGAANAGALGEAALLLTLPSGAYTLQCQRLLKSPGDLTFELFDVR